MPRVLRTHTREELLWQNHRYTAVAIHSDLDDLHQWGLTLNATSLKEACTEAVGCYGGRGGLLVEDLRTRMTFRASLK